MLVLSRGKEERIIIGDDIILTVLEIRNGKVRLAFDAPKNVAIYREEVYDDIKKNGPQKGPL